jgi:cytochrome P450
MSFVWDESLRQAAAMLQSWTTPSQSAEGISSVQKDIRTLSLNVLAATGFRKSYDFRGSADTAAQDEAGSYRDALQTVLDNAILIMILPYRYLQGSLVPKKLVRVGNAARSFKKHMVQMLDDETSALRDNKPDSGSLMSSFVRALDTHEREVVAHPNLKGSKDGKRGLSIDEIFGNLFVINFAGHDTTANTLAFTMLLLAAHPEVQVWLAEELSAIEDIKASAVDEWDYYSVFPRLKRCQAVLLETLRLYPPIMSLPKWTKEHAQTIQVGEKVLVIPPGVGTSPHLLAIHTHPKYWTDPFVWRPSRWIVGGQEYASNSKLCGEDLRTPVPHTYFPWSDGPQNCPGEKFSKVEAVAVLACLLKSHRLTVKKLPGEAEETARERAIKCTNDVNLEMLLRMRDADRVKLVCTKA